MYDTPQWLQDAQSDFYTYWGIDCYSATSGNQTQQKPSLRTFSWFIISLKQPWLGPGIHINCFNHQEGNPNWNENDLMTGIK